MSTNHEIYAKAFADLTTPRPIAEYHEDMGDVLWWKFPIDEPPYVGSPLDRGIAVAVTIQTADKPASDVMVRDVGGWPACHTHFTPLPIPQEPPK